MYVPSSVKKGEEDVVIKEEMFVYRIQTMKFFFSLSYNNVDLRKCLYWSIYLENGSGS